MYLYIQKGMNRMLKSWFQYSETANSLYKSMGLIPVMGEFCTELEEIVLDLLVRAKFDGKATIKLLINSSGGNTSSCIAMRNALKLIQLDTVGIVLARAHSSAFILLQACDKRIALDGSTLVLHWGGTRFDNNELVAVVAGETWPFDNRRQGNLSIMSEISRRTGVPMDKLIGYANSERYFTAQEALSANLVDEVLSSDIPPEFLRLLSAD
jgi:ATP-dependent protease ClpP protease subunit